MYFMKNDGNGAALGRPGNLPLKIFKLRVNMFLFNNIIRNKIPAEPAMST